MSIEETYQKLDGVEHILHRPDMYVGSCSAIVQVAPTFSFDHGLEFKKVACVEGLKKIFDEILVNAADHKTRNPKSMTYLNVYIKGGVIGLKNNGPGLPVQIHKKHNEWVPELIFGSLRTSSNFKDSQKKLTGGRNGYGAKLTNVFSTKFKVVTTDAQAKKQFSMTWTKHMSKKSKPQIKDLANPQPSTLIEFEPDMDLFQGIDSLDQIQGTLAKRLLDVAGTCSQLSVKLNNQKMPVRGFKEYCTYVAKAMDAQTPVAYVRTNERWEIGLCASPNEEAKDISFVNHISTPNGGTHARAVRWALESELRARMEKKLKTKIQLSKLRNNLLIFVNCMVENPNFGSQTKVELKTQSLDFGMRPNLESKHFSKLFKESNIMDIVEERSKGGLGGKAPTTSKARTIHEKGLKDANWAGTKRSHLCRLILTEGDSAATLAVSGREKAGGPDINGIYPLRGKLFNPCKGAKPNAFNTIAKRKELNALVRILNLKTNLDYTQEEHLKTLRYGKLVIMVDQDKDGAHIGGLIMNFLKYWNPSILKAPGFLHQFITPVLKATKGKEIVPFFSEIEHEAWKKTHDVQAYKVKYYKGLGTSTPNEAKAYFSDLHTHLLNFETLDQESSDMIDVAFSGAKKQERKEWIMQRGGDNIQAPDFVTRPQQYAKFLNSSLMAYNDASIVRAIPSMIDGLKEVQRKVMFTCFKKNVIHEHKVASVASMVTETANYHHGESSMMSAIVGMAQSFVGKNNINLLFPSGQFGSRLQGGKDAASPRYIFTKLSLLTRKLFVESDDHVLEYLEDEGHTIEPRTYAPILPMSLVNGVHGIATGWSTDLPMYNPKTLARYILNDLRNQELHICLDPWYKNFKGTITKLAGGDYQTKGVYTFGQNCKVHITELPIGTWTEAYIEKMVNMKDGKSKFASNVVTKHKDNSSDVAVDIVFTLSPRLFQTYQETPLAFEKDFGLISKLSIQNIHLLDASGRIKKYANVEDIVKEFMAYRLDLYQKRKVYMLKAMEELCQGLTCKMVFINGVIDETIPVRNVAKQETVRATIAKGIHNIHTIDSLLKMGIGSLNKERVQALEAQLARTTKERQMLEATTIKDMWIWDLEEFLKALAPKKRKASSSLVGVSKK